LLPKPQNPVVLPGILNFNEIKLFNVQRGFFFRLVVV